MRHARTASAAHDLANGKQVTIIVTEAPDGRWTYAWWCPMPLGRVEWAHGEGQKGTQQEAMDAAVAEAKEREGLS